MDRRIWSLTAESHAARVIAATQTTVGAARDRLSAALAEIRQFAEHYDEVREWASWFAKSEALLDAPEPDAPYHRDILPSDAALERRQLAASVVQGWVFGGMGSWNDCGFVDPEKQREYDRVGAGLYTELLVGLSAAANYA